MWAPVWDIAVSDDVIYVLYYGIHVVDISDLHHPVEIAHYDEGAVYNAVSMEVHGGIAYVVNRFDERGLHILEVSDPDNIYPLGSWVTESMVSMIEIGNDYAYIGSDDDIFMIDISDPEEPLLTDALQLETTIQDISVSEGFVYVAAGTDGIRAIDASDPEHLVEAGYYDTPGSAYQVHSRGNLIYVADRTNFGVYQNILVSVPDDDRYVLMPQECTLYPAYPNPFNSTTTITYTLPLQSNVAMQVYNTRGQLVDVLLDRVMPAGRHSVVWDASRFSAGVYLVRMVDRDRNSKETQKVVLLK